MYALFTCICSCLNKITIWYSHIYTIEKLMTNGAMKIPFESKKTNAQFTISSILDRANIERGASCKREVQVLNYIRAVYPP